MESAGRLSPHTQELGLLPGGRRLRLHLQAVDVGDGDDGGGHVPRQTHEGADDEQNGHPEQVQVVTGPFLVQTTESRSEVMWPFGSLLLRCSLSEETEKKSKTGRHFRASLPRNISHPHEKNDNHI